MDGVQTQLKASETRIADLQKASEARIEDLEKARQASEARIEDLIKAREASEARIEDLLKVIHNLEEAAARLKSAKLDGQTLLRAIQGTPTTRADAWDFEKLEPIPHPKFKEEFVITTAEKTILSTHVLGITQIEAKSKEKDYYAPMVACLASVLDLEICNVMDTHDTFYLAGGAPDISLSVTGISKPQTACMYGFIEVKVPGPNLGTSQNLGQVKDYLLRLIVGQQHRTHFWGFLSDGTQYILVEVTIHPNHRTGNGAIM